MGFRCPHSGTCPRLVITKCGNWQQRRFPFSSSRHNLETISQNEGIDSWLAAAIRASSGNTPLERRLPYQLRKDGARSFRMKGREVAIAAVGAWWLSNVVIPAKALDYGCAAERDERNNLPCTAAMEWRNAAELFAANARVAEYFWRQWERVMRLPRRLAGPVGDYSNVQFPSCRCQLRRNQGHDSTYVVPEK
jgi:hypothetical protein